MSARIISDTDELIVYTFQCSMCGTAPIQSKVYAHKKFAFDFACQECIDEDKRTVQGDYVPIKSIVFVPN